MALDRIVYWQKCLQWLSAAEVHLPDVLAILLAPLKSDDRKAFDCQLETWFQQGIVSAEMRTCIWSNVLYCGNWEDQRQVVRPNAKPFSHIIDNDTTFQMKMEVFKNNPEHLRRNNIYSFFGTVCLEDVAGTFPDMRDMFCVFVQWIAKNYIDDTDAVHMVRMVMDFNNEKLRQGLVHRLPHTPIIEESQTRTANAPDDPPVVPFAERADLTGTPPFISASEDMDIDPFDLHDPPDSGMSEKEVESEPENGAENDSTDSEELNPGEGNTKGAPVDPRLRVPPGEEQSMKVSCIPVGRYGSIEWMLSAGCHPSCKKPWIRLSTVCQNRPSSAEANVNLSFENDSIEVHFFVGPHDTKDPKRIQPSDKNAIKRPSRSAKGHTVRGGVPFLWLMTGLRKMLAILTEAGASDNAVDKQMQDPSLPGWLLDTHPVFEVIRKRYVKGTAYSLFFQMYEETLSGNDVNQAEFRAQLPSVLLQYPTLWNLLKQDLGPILNTKKVAPLSFSKPILYKGCQWRISSGTRRNRNQTKFVRVCHYVERCPSHPEPMKHLEMNVEVIKRERKRARIQWWVGPEDAWGKQRDNLNRQRTRGVMEGTILDALIEGLMRSRALLPLLEEKYQQRPPSSADVTAMKDGWLPYGHFAYVTLKEAFPQNQGPFAYQALGPEEHGFHAQLRELAENDHFLRDILSESLTEGVPQAGPPSPSGSVSDISDVDSDFTDEGDRSRKRSNRDSASGRRKKLKAEESEQDEGEPTEKPQSRACMVKYKGYDWSVKMLYGGHGPPTENYETPRETREYPLFKIATSVPLGKQPSLQQGNLELRLGSHSKPPHLAFWIGSPNRSGQKTNTHEVFFKGSIVRWIVVGMQKLAELVDPDGSREYTPYNAQEVERRMSKAFQKRGDRRVYGSFLRSWSQRLGAEERQLRKDLLSAVDPQRREMKTYLTHDLKELRLASDGGKNLARYLQNEAEVGEGEESPDEDVRSAPLIEKGYEKIIEVIGKFDFLYKRWALYSDVLRNKGAWAGDWFRICRLERSNETETFIPANIELQLCRNRADIWFWLGPNVDSGARKKYKGLEETSEQYPYPRKKLLDVNNRQACTVVCALINGLKTLCSEILTLEEPFERVSPDDWIPFDHPACRKLCKFAGHPQGEKQKYRKILSASLSAREDCDLQSTMLRFAAKWDSRSEEPRRLKELLESSVDVHVEGS